MFLDDRAETLREMGRVVKPGGRLAVAVWDARSRGCAAILHEADRIVTFDAPALIVTAGKAA